MGTVIPNRTGEAIVRGTENLLQAMMFRQQQNIRERAQSLSENQFEEDKKMNALRTSLAFGAFTADGSTVMDNPFMHGALSTLFPGENPADPNGLGGVVLNPQTFEEFLLPAWKQQFETLSPERKEELMNLGITRIMTGSPETEEELGVRRDRAALLGEAMTTITTNPRAVEDIGRTMFGLDQPIRLNINGREVEFDTATAANLSVELMKFREAMSSQSKTQFADTFTSMVDRLIGQAKDMQIALGEPKARQIVSAMMEDDPSTALQSLYDAHAGDAETQAVISMFGASHSLADNTLNLLMQRTPEGQAWANVMEAGQRLAEFLPREQVSEALDNFTASLQAAGLPIARYTKPGLFGRGGEFILPGGPGADGAIQPMNSLQYPGAPTPAAPAGGGPEIIQDAPEGSRINGQPFTQVVPAALDAVLAGEVTIEEVEASAGATVAGAVRSLMADPMVSGTASALSASRSRFSHTPSPPAAPTQNRPMPSGHPTAGQLSLPPEGMSSLGAGELSRLAALEGDSELDRISRNARRIQAGTFSKPSVVIRQATEVIERGMKAQRTLSALQDSIAGGNLSAPQRRRIQRLEEEIAKARQVQRALGISGGGGTNPPNQPQQEVTTPAGAARTEVQDTGVSDPSRVSTRPGGYQVYDTPNRTEDGKVPSHRLDIPSGREQGETWEQYEERVNARSEDSFSPEAFKVNKDLAALDTEVRNNVRALIRAAARDGIRISVNETYRPTERQEYLFKIGRSLPGSPVTWTLTSDHSTRRAADLKTSDRGYRWIQENAPGLGFTVLGMSDPGHVSMPLPKQVAGNREEEEE